MAAVALGAGDWRTRTEHRAAPPDVRPGAVLSLGEIRPRVVAALGRRVAVELASDRDALWQALYASGAPVQYAIAASRCRSTPCRPRMPHDRGRRRCRRRGGR